MEEKDQALLNCERCTDNTLGNYRKQGLYWLKSQAGLHRAVSSGKGRYGKLSPQQRKALLIRIETKSLGTSPTLEHDKLKFKEWFKETFDREY